MIISLHFDVLPTEAAAVPDAVAASDVAVERRGDVEEEREAEFLGVGEAAPVVVGDAIDVEQGDFHLVADGVVGGVGLGFVDEAAATDGHGHLGLGQRGVIDEAEHAELGG